MYCVLLPAIILCLSIKCDINTEFDENTRTFLDRDVRSFEIEGKVNLTLLIRK